MSLRPCGWAANGRGAVFTRDDETLAELVRICLGNDHRLQQLRSLADDILDGVPDHADADEKTRAFIEDSAELAALTTLLAHDSDCMMRFAENYFPEVFEIAALAHFRVDEVPNSVAGLA